MEPQHPLRSRRKGWTLYELVRVYLLVTIAGSRSQQQTLISAFYNKWESGPNLSRLCLYHKPRAQFACDHKILDLVVERHEYFIRKARP
jgi:hypothetical protein